METLDEVCESLVKDVKDAKAAGIVDLGSGLILSVAHNVSYFNQDYIDAVAAAAVDMFRGENVSNVEKLLSAQRGAPVSKTVTEVQMSTTMTQHFMIVLPEKPDMLMVLITGKGANLGMGWASVRQAVKLASPLCP